MSTTRNSRVNWHTALPPPTPKIINLPRRHTTRRRKTITGANKQTPATTPLEMIHTYNYKGKLESLFGVEREFTRASLVLMDSPERRERVAEEDGCGELSEEKWRFQAEILRAECNFLRVERKLALKKLEKNRVRIERTLKSALQNLASGRKKLCEGKNMEVVLEEEMKELAEKLEELQSSYNGSEDHELQKCKNFDKKASRLQRRLEKLGKLTDDECIKEIKSEVNKDSSNLNCKSHTKSTDVEILERKMEGLSKGVLDGIEEEYGSIINNSVTSSASASKQIDFPDHLSFTNYHTKDSNNKCSGRCKLLVKRIVEQVRAETEQWSQMQEMLGKLRQEMEELQTSKDFWETQALASNDKIQVLQSECEEWKEKAIEYETKTNKLQKEVDFVKGEIEKMKKDHVKEVVSTPKKPVISLSKQIERETKNRASCRMKGQCDDVIGSSTNRHEENKKESRPLSLGKHLAREKRILVSKLKENRWINHENSRRKGYNFGRSPFKDIGNSTSSSNAIFPLHCSDPASS